MLARNQIVDARSSLLTAFESPFFPSPANSKYSSRYEDLKVDFVIRGNTARKSTSGGSNIVPIYSVGDKGKVLYQFDLKYNFFEDPLVDIAYHEKIINTNTKRIVRLIQSGRTAPGVRRLGREDLHLLHQCDAGGGKSAYSRPEKKILLE